MTRWEYKYIDLFRMPDRVKAVAAFQAEAAQAGADGWEAVGEVAINHGGPVAGTFPVLMLKRPMP
jgi:hypothetical protein